MRTAALSILGVLALGISGYAQKPVDFDSLLSAVTNDSVRTHHASANQADQIEIRTGTHHVHLAIDSDHQLRYCYVHEDEHTEGLFDELLPVETRTDQVLTLLVTGNTARHLRINTIDSTATLSLTPLAITLRNRQPSDIIMLWKQLAEQNTHFGH